MFPQFEYEVLSVAADAETRVIKTVNWRYNAIVNRKRVASTLGSIDLLPPAESADVIPFENVKYEDIASWVVASVGGPQAFSAATAALEAELRAQMAEAEARQTVVVLAPHWGA